jgi:hypothetical protein
MNELIVARYEPGRGRSVVSILFENEGPYGKPIGLDTNDVPPYPAEEVKS